MIEDYAIRMRTGRSEKTGIFDATRSGKLKERTRFVETYETLAGNFAPDKWLEAAMKEVEACGEMETYNKVKAHCKEHCAWLWRDRDLTEYALDCTCSRVYQHWADFQDEVVWM